MADEAEDEADDRTEPTDEISEEPGRVMVVAGTVNTDLAIVLGRQWIKAYWLPSG